MPRRVPHREQHVRHGSAMILSTHRVRRCRFVAGGARHVLLVAREIRGEVRRDVARRHGFIQEVTARRLGLRHGGFAPCLG